MVGRGHRFDPDTRLAPCRKWKDLLYMRRFAAMPAREKVPSVMAQSILIDRFGEDPDLYTWYVAPVPAVEVAKLCTTNSGRCSPRCNVTRGLKISKSSKDV
jgi:hypothetical protein